MATMSARQLRRHLRNALSVRRWSLRQKVGIGVWIPVLIVAFALFTGPSRSSGSPSAESPATTTTTLAVTTLTMEPIVPAYLGAAPRISLQQRVVKWIKGVPPKRSRAEKLALLRYNRTVQGHSPLAARKAGPKILILHPGRSRAGHR